MKRKMLEILVDEDDKITVSSDYNPFSEFSSENDINVKEFYQVVKHVLDNLVESLFLSYVKDQKLSRIIRTLTVADILADDQPYECTESLWDSMMNSMLPKLEPVYSKMKAAHGYKTDVIKPIKFGSWGGMMPFSSTADKYNAEKCAEPLDSGNEKSKGFEKSQKSADGKKGLRN